MRREWAEVIEVDLDRIRPNLRLVYPSESIEALSRLIRSRGQVEPIQIWFDGECFRIQDGEMQWRVCKKLGISRVKAVIVEGSYPFRAKSTL